MEFAVLGWPADEVALRLDYRRFSYAGKFVMTNTGKAVVRDPEAVVRDPEAVTESTGAVDSDRVAAGEYDTDVLAAVAFNEDRTDPATVWLRYVTVREDRRGEGLGPRLLAYLAARLEDRGYDRLRIAVNNPFAYEACYKVGFGYTGERTGLAELVLERPAPRGRDPERYRAGLSVYRERDPGDPEAAFLAARTDASPPARVDPPA